jgi:pilus assembly protein CpaF
VLTISLKSSPEAEALRLPHPRCIVGRGSDCGVSVQGWKVSRHHAEIFVSNERVFVRDLGSTFGTFVNDQKIDDTRPLEADDELRVGTSAFNVKWDSELPRPPAVAGAAKVAPPARAGAPAPAPVSPAPAPPAAERATFTAPTDETFKYRRLLQNKLVEAFDVRRTDTHLMSDDELHRLTEQLITDLIGKMTDLPPNLDRKQLLDEVRDEAIGLGPLEPMLADPTITEIMVNRSDEVFVERLGKLERWPVSFTSDRAVLGIIERIVAPIGRRIDESSPMVDARLKDGSRVNAVIPPLALKGPSITIRKFSKRKLDSTDLLKFGSASPAMVEFMRVCVEQRKNVLISGGTGSGKTTLLNILSNFIPHDERIVTIEDAAELQLHHPNLVSLEARPANIEGKGNVAIRELVKNSLRMRPDRIVVGECRGGEALDMLQAMNTGHDGSLTTAHANSPRDMLARLEVMVLMAGMDLPVTAIREQVASAIDIVVQQTRFACGTRKVTSITEITGVESGRIQLQEVFAFVRNGVDANGRTTGNFMGRGFVPEFYEELKSIGIPLDLSIFHDGMKREGSTTKSKEGP